MFFYHKYGEECEVSSSKLGPFWALSQVFYINQKYKDWVTECTLFYFKIVIIHV